jgi:hypothetical protein
MKIQIGFFILIMFAFANCKPTQQTITNKAFNQFDQYFEALEWADTLDSRKTDWALGRSHEVNSPIISDKVFYETVDTAKMDYDLYNPRLYAEGKIKLSEKYTAYFMTRQMDDITYDRTTLLLVFDTHQNFVQDVVFSEFVGYEGFITETQSRLFKNEKGVWQIESERNESYYDAENQEYIEKVENWSLEFSVGSWQ